MKRTIRPVAPASPVFQSLEPRSYFAAFSPVSGFTIAGGAAVEAMATDAAGNVYVSGFLSEDVSTDFDPSSRHAAIVSSDAASNFIAKYSPTGRFVWVRQLPAGADPQSLATDAGGDLYVAGSFSGTVDFDLSRKGTVNLTATSNNSDDVFIARYRPDGSFVWANALLGDSADRVTKLVVDRLGFVHLIGDEFISGSFLATFSGKGRNVRFADFGGEASFQALAADRAGNLYVGGVVDGTLSGSVDLDLSPSATHLVGDQTSFLLKLDGKYNYAWHARWDLADQVFISDLAADATGVFFVGQYDSTRAPDFNPGHRTFALPGQGDFDAFAAKYSLKGAFVFARNLGGGGEDSASAAALDPATGDLLVAGTFSGKAFIQPGVNSNRLTSQGDTDIFLARYTSAGNFLTATPAGSAGEESDPLLAVTPAGALLAGGINLPLDLDPGKKKFLLQPSADAADGPEDGYLAFFKYA